MFISPNTNGLNFLILPVAPILISGFWILDSGLVNKNKTQFQQRWGNKRLSSGRASGHVFCATTSRLHIFGFLNTQILNYLTKLTYLLPSSPFPIRSRDHPIYRYTPQRRFLSSTLKMTTTENTEPKVEETKPAEEKTVTSSSVFSMFGGGAKKEKKDEDDDRGDNSGSAKAQRDAAAAAKGDEVSNPAKSSFRSNHFRTLIRLSHRKKLPSQKMSTSSPLSSLPRRSRPRPTRSPRSSSSRCAPSCSSSSVRPANGRSAELATSGY